MRNAGSKILSTSGKDDDEYSQVYDEDAAGTDTNQKSPKSEVTRKKDEKHKTVEGNKEENMEAGKPVIETNNEDKENTEKDETCRKGGGSQKRTSKQSMRNTGSKILSTSGKDDDEYSQVYETDDDEDAAGTGANQKSPKSEVTRKEDEKHKTVEGNKEENMEAGKPLIETNNEDKENTEKDEKQEPKG